MTAQEEVSAWQTVNQSTLVVILASELDGFSQATFSRLFPPYNGDHLRASLLGNKSAFSLCPSWCLYSSTARLTGCLLLTFR